MIGCYNDFIANNKAIQDAGRQDGETSQVKAYRKLSKAYSDYISDLFEDMSKCVTVESFLTVLYIVQVTSGSKSYYRSWRLIIA